MVRAGMGTDRRAGKPSLACDGRRWNVACYHTHSVSAPMETAMRGQVILSHGSDSGPDATKISVLAALAESLGWRTQRPDYRTDDARGHAGSVAPRIARLRATIEALDMPPLLAGSGRGAFVSGLVT